MTIDTVRSLFQRDLERLQKEVELYQDESALWKVEKNISNSAGNLCLHLVGNLNTYIGAALGKTGYIRKRELEFSRKDVSRSELVASIKDTRQMVDRVLAGVNEEILQSEFPVLVFEEKTTTEYMLVHLVSHLAYHLGQVNYHRRLVDK